MRNMCPKVSFQLIYISPRQKLPNTNEDNKGIHKAEFTTKLPVTSNPQNRISAPSLSPTVFNMQSKNVFVFVLFALAGAAPVAKEGLEPYARLNPAGSDTATAYSYQKRVEEDSDNATSYGYQKREDSDSDAAARWGTDATTVAYNSI